MRVDEFDFELPPDRIALRPAEKRETARLLVVRSQSESFEDHHIGDLPTLLAPGDVVVVNDTALLTSAGAVLAPRVMMLPVTPFELIMLDILCQDRLPFPSVVKT